MEFYNLERKYIFQEKNDLYLNHRQELNIESHWHALSYLYAICFPRSYSVNFAHCPLPKLCI